MNSKDELSPMDSCTAGRLRGALGKVQTNSIKEGESALSKNGVIWLGHPALGDDEWKVGDPEHPLNTADFWMRGSRPNLKVNVGWDDGEANKNTESG
jgi:hypothetical protein